jgi:hypothetical protein
METVNDERYMDMISGEFAYDPVRLPLDQDPTQVLYNRKTLESIWETEHEATNPYTRQWFDMKSAIPQTELRREMEHYIDLHKIPSYGGEYNVIGEYTVILDEDKMKQHLKMLGETISEILIREKPYWVTIWRKINLLRLCCQFHDQNIQTFRSLHGFRYFNRLISQMNSLFESDPSEKDIRELGLLDVSKEITRTIDVIGLIPSDMVSMELHSSSGLMNMLVYTYNNSGCFRKFQSIVLRLLCKTFDHIAVDSYIDDNVCHPLILSGLKVAMNQLSRLHAKDISSEDLNHGIGILQAAWVLSLELDSYDDYVQAAWVLSLELDFYDQYVQVLVNAVLICIAREIPEGSHEISGFREGQILEAHARARHNSEALEKGLWIIKDIIIKGGALLQTFNVFGGSSLLTEITGMFNRDYFKRFAEVQNKDGDLICPKGCKTFYCVHIRIAELAMDIFDNLS